MAIVIADCNCRLLDLSERKACLPHAQPPKTECPLLVSIYCERSLKESLVVGETRVAPAQPIALEPHHPSAHSSPFPCGSTGESTAHNSVFTVRQLRMS